MEYIPDEQLKIGYFSAILEGNLKKAKFYVERGVDIYYTQGVHTPLRAAILKGHLEIVKWLVEELKMVPKKDGRSLHIASIAEKKDKRLVKYLLEHGCDINEDDPKLGTPLLLALGGGDEDFARFLIENGAQVDKQSKAVEASTVLHKCAQHCSWVMFQYLAEKGASAFVDSLDSQNYTPLMLAAKAGNCEMISGIIKTYKVDPNRVTDTSALFMAAQDNFPEAARILIEEFKANPSIVAGERKISPLHIAASNDHYKVVEILLKNGCVVDCEDSRGFTPLMMAASEGYLRTVTLLVNAGADVNKVASSSGECALHVAVTQDNIDIIKFLLEKGAINDIKDQNGLTPSQVALIRAEQEKVRARKEIYQIAASTIDNWGLKVCFRCSKLPPKNQQLKRCGNCKKVFYCSVECQKEDWKTHKGVCNKN